MLVAATRVFNVGDLASRINVDVQGKVAWLNASVLTSELNDLLLAVDSAAEPSQDAAR